MKRFTDYIQESLLDDEDNVINNDYLQNICDKLIKLCNDYKIKVNLIGQLIKYIDKTCDRLDFTYCKENCDTITDQFNNLLVAHYNRNDEFVIISNKKDILVKVVNYKSTKLEYDEAPANYYNSLRYARGEYIIIYDISDNIYNTIKNTLKTIQLKESLLEPEADIIDKKAYYKVGSYYEDDKIKGIIASLKDNGEPHLIMSLDQSENTVTWYDAMEYNKTLKDGWHIPSKAELEEVWYNSKVTDILNKAIEKYNGTKLNKWYWSSSEYNKSNAYGIGTSYGSIYNDGKHYLYYVRPFVAL